MTKTWQEVCGEREAAARELAAMLGLSWVDLGAYERQSLIEAATAQEAR